jgi:hypothetical protein
LTTDTYGRDDVLCVTRYHESDRNLAIVGPVGRIECATAMIESHLPADLPLQGALEIRRLREDIDRFAVGAAWERNEHEGSLLVGFE